ncbi:hypothetical protein B481_0456 [Planococcus halocryophilus Or1]|nr:hypothetical protein B481_0456 [Planococcus halocryophilus Or1]
MIKDTPFSRMAAQSTDETENLTDATSLSLVNRSTNKEIDTYVFQ